VAWLAARDELTTRRFIHPFHLCSVLRERIVNRLLTNIVKPNVSGCHRHQRAWADAE